MSDRVLQAVDGAVCTLTLNRADKRNAIDSPMVQGLLDALASADLDAGIRVVAIRGAGPDFCAGADLGELLASADVSPEENARSAAQLGEVFIRVREMPKPVVAVVHGRALAGGCGLATACDLVVAQADARFGYPEIRRGFVPAMVMTMLVRAVGQPVAFDLVATGRELTAEEAARLGLVARVWPAGTFEGEVTTLCRTLAEASPTALGLIKRQLHALDGKDFRSGIALGAEVNATARATPDFREAVNQFLTKR